MRKLRSLLFVDPFIVASTIFHGTLSMFVSLFDDARSRRQNAVSRAWARSLVWASGAKIVVEGLDRIHKDGTYVFASNHASYMDTPVVLSRIPVQFRFMAKAGLFKIPFLGWYLGRAGHIPVPREDPRAALKTLTHAAETMRSLGIAVLIFPEGGRTADGELRPFRDGAAYIAIKGQVPLVPVALVGTRDLLPRGSKIFNPCTITMRIGDPISTEGLTTKDRAALTERVRERVSEMLREQPAAVEK
jgi:1-acyl-sn-glycerol-3-phosphate acyltransferase